MSKLKRISERFKILPLLGLILAVLYMTNAWDGIIYLGLSGLVFLVTHLNINRRSGKATKEQKHKNKEQRYNLKPRILSLFFVICFLLFTFFLFSLPFSLYFHPFVKGIGVVGGWEAAQALGLIKPTAEEVVKIGPFLLEKGNNARSPLWMLAVLWGFFFFNAIVFIIYLLKNSKFGYRNPKQIPNSNAQNSKQRQSGSFGFWILDFGFRILRKVDLFILLLIFLSTLLLAFPEFFYAKDIYPAHYRANTMFKLGYQAFIMLSIASSYIIVTLTHRLRKENFVCYLLFVILLIPQLFLVSIYPCYAINSYYGNLKLYRGLDGAAWLKNQYPDDYQAILWLKNHEPRATSHVPVIVEAVGESYTDYARVSAYTGLPTILGWPVHQWLWRGSFDEPGKRISEVQTIYESKDLEQTKRLLKKYNVSYLFLGTLEREKYKNLAEEKFEKLGKVVFESKETRIYQLSHL